MPFAQRLFQRAGLRGSAACCGAALLLAVLAGCGDREHASAPKPPSDEAAEGPKKSVVPAVPGLAEMQKDLAQKMVIDEALPPPPPDDAYVQDERVPSGSLVGVCFIPCDKKVDLPATVPPEVFGLSDAVKTPLAGEAEYYRTYGVSLPVLLEPPYGDKQYKVTQAALCLRNVKAGALEPLSRPTLIVNDVSSRVEAFTPERYWVAFGQARQRLEISNGSIFPGQVDLVYGETGEKLFDVEMPAYSDKDFPGQPFWESQLLSRPKIIKSPIIPKPGLLKVTDRRRPWLKGYVIAVDNPYAAMSDRGGAFKMDQVPVGTYAVEVFHPWYKPAKAVHTVEIREKETAFLSVEFEMPAILKEPPSLPVNAVTNWAVLGPFSADFAKVLDVEKEWDFASSYRGKNRMPVQWRSVSAKPVERLPAGALSVQDIYGRVPNLESTTYLAATLDAKSEQEVLIGLGASVQVKLWLNGELLHACATYDQLTANERYARGRLKAGANRLLVKLVCGERGGAFLLTCTADAKTPESVLAAADKRPTLPSTEGEWVEGGKITGKAKDEYLVLNESIPWKQYYFRAPMQLSDTALKNEQELKKLIPGTTKEMRVALPYIERLVKGGFKDRTMDWNALDWRDAARLRWGDAARGFDSVILDLLSAAPPAGWSAPDFDDSAWLLAPIKPPKWDRPGAAYLPDTRNQFDGFYTRTMYLRTVFEAPDPAASGEWKLAAAYRGGIRVLLNGKEIARQHLPAGELKPETKAEDYPLEAYANDEGEFPPGTYGPLRDMVPDIRLPYERAPKGEGKLYQYGRAFGYHLSEKAFTRLTELRDRKLVVRIPAAALVKGANVLAVEIHASLLHPAVPGYGGDFYQLFWTRPDINLSWDHARLVWLNLTETSGKAPAAVEGPRGFQAWADDMHNWTCHEDFNPQTGSSGTLRFTGCLNGSFSGKIVVRSVAELNGLKVRISDLTGPDGTVLPASVVRIRAMVPHALAETGLMGQGRGTERIDMNDTARDLVWRATREEGILKWPNSYNLVKKEMDRIRFYDHVSDELPDKLAANTALPYWLTLAVPSSAKPGAYKGTFTVEAAGEKPLSVPVEAEVIGWRLPEPPYFNTRVTLEQSPSALARWYNTPPWSDKHFELIEASFRQMARAGNCMLIVPVIQRSEYGNMEDSLIRWIRKKDGTLAFDYKDLDRYLDLALKHMGRPKVIEFAIMHYQSAGARPMVNVLNEATGAVEKVGLGWYEDALTRYPLWQAFATALDAHMKEKGLEDVMYWGNAGDNINDVALVDFMREIFPHIRWTANPHAYTGGSAGSGVDRELFRCVSEIHSKTLAPQSKQGWKQPETYINPWCPRGFTDGIAPPYYFRLAVDFALCGGADGVGRLGFDYLNHSWGFGYMGGEWNPPGMPCQFLGWPGKNGVESSARFEAFIEGIQEGEARIYLEQAADRGLLSKELAAEAAKVLRDRIKGEVAIRYGENRCDTYTTGYQERSRALFKVAARAAEQDGLDIDRCEIERELPAQGRLDLSVILRNWTSAPRAWKVAGSEPWLKTEKAEGALSTGAEALKVRVDGAAFKPGETRTAVLKITDAAANQTRELKVTLRTVKPVELLAEHFSFNVTAGGTETRQFRIHNRAATPQPWELKSSAPWMRVDPPSGTLPPDSSVFVNVIAAPKETEAKTLDVNLQFVAAGGQVNEALQSRVWVLPPYKQPERLPFGRVIFLEKVEAGRVKLHQELFHGDPIRNGSRIVRGPVKRTTPSFSLATMQGARGAQSAAKEVIPIIGKRRFERGMWVLPNHETVYNIEGMNCTAFSAFVGIPLDAIREAMRELHLKINFEVYVDGKLRVQSGLISVQDEGRMLTVEGLEGAKELRLVTRLDSGKDNNGFLGLWADANLYEKTGKSEEDVGKQKGP